MGHDTINCIVIGAWTGHGKSQYKLYYGWGAALWVAIQRVAWPLGCIGRQVRHGAGSATIRRWRRATRRPTRLYSAQFSSQQRARVRGNTGSLYSRLGLRHGPRHGRNTAGLGAVHAVCARSLGSGCAPGAPNPFLDSVHCF